jgi:hypothetical protein
LRADPRGAAQALLTDVKFFPRPAAGFSRGAERAQAGTGLAGYFPVVQHSQGRTMSAACVADQSESRRPPRDSLFFLDYVSGPATLF